MKTYKQIQVKSSRSGKYQIYVINKMKGLEVKFR